MLSVILLMHIKRIIEIVGVFQAIAKLHISKRKVWFLYVKQVPWVNLFGSIIESSLLPQEHGKVFFSSSLRQQS